MKKCYADTKLKISQDEFTKPKNLAPWAECKTETNDSLYENHNTDEFDF